MTDKNKITIFGLGHIGLPTASLFADKGFNVKGIARDDEKLRLISKGISPIDEPGLSELVKITVENGHFTVSYDEVEAVSSSNIMIIIVPTPMDEQNRADLTAVKEASKTISQGLKKGDLVVVESTVPQGTCDNIVIPILEESGLKAGRTSALPTPRKGPYPITPSMR